MLIALFERAVGLLRVAGQHQRLPPARRRSRQESRRSGAGIAGQGAGGVDERGANGRAGRREDRQSRRRRNGVSAARTPERQQPGETRSGGGPGASTFRPSFRAHHVTDWDDLASDGFFRAFGVRLSVGLALARDYDARLVLLHVVPPPIVVYGGGVVPADPGPVPGRNEGKAPRDRKHRPLMFVWNRK